MRPMRPACPWASFIAIAALAIGCGGSMAEISSDERRQEDDALLARSHHDEVVRLVGDPQAGPIPPEACAEMCPRLPRVHERCERLCAIAGRDDHDEATQYLCEDAQSRERALTQQLAGCSCP